MCYKKNFLNSFKVKQLGQIQCVDEYGDGWLDKYVTKLYPKQATSVKLEYESNHNKMLNMPKYRTKYGNTRQ